jgi:hypothetical protein
VARGDEARRELQAFREQLLGIGITAQARGCLGQHPEGRDVGRVAVEVRAQQRLRGRDAALGKCGRRTEQARIACRGLDVVGVGRIRTGAVTHRREVIAEAPPAVGEVGLELQRAAQRDYGCFAAAGCGERERQLVVCRRGSWLGAREGLERGDGGRQVPGRPLRAAEDQGGHGVARHGLEDRARLLCGKGGILGEQACRVVEGDLKRADGLRRAAHQDGSPGLNVCGGNERLGR